MSHQHASTWPCASCTLINESQAVRCEACSRPRLAGDTYAADVSLLPNQLPNGDMPNRTRRWPSIIQTSSRQINAIAQMANLRETYHCEFCLEKHCIENSILLDVSY
jgi:hypothetical protein